MSKDEARSSIGQFVRVAPFGGHPHYGGAKLIGIEGPNAVIIPFGHKQYVRVPLSKVKAWKAANQRRK